MEHIQATQSSKERKRAVRKRAERIEIVKGELFLLKHKVKITDPKEQKRILEACHSDHVISRHFGVMKTCKRLTERFYWRGIAIQAKDLVSYA